MRKIITRWCETGQLSLDDAIALITEYLSYSNRTITPQELQAILTVGQGLVPINWDMICGQIAMHNGFRLMLVRSAPDQAGNRRLLYRKVY